MIHAKKSLGQHFLHESAFAERLADQISPEIRLVAEIGPGTGMLTRFLTDRFDQLLLVEKDHRLAAMARQKWEGNPAIVIAEEDVLKFDFRAHFGESQFALVGNFPYNISSQIVFRVLELHDLVPEMIGMFQYEMARRIAAGPGTKDYGVISVLTALYYEATLLFQVPPGAFTPPPKVNSAVIRLDRKRDIKLNFEEKHFRTVVKTAFSQRRKMLRNTLRGLLSAETLADPYFDKRPEHVSLDDFVRLTCLFEEQKGK